MKIQDCEKLANLLYPNVTRTVEDLLTKYPPRNLPNGAEVLRLAPSPTGFLHLGHFYSAFIQYLTIRQKGGIFYLRLEDTDKKREVAGSGEIAYQVLLSYGIEINEGYRGNAKETGNYGPYVQSKRLDIYEVFAKHLVALGHAFPCFCEKAENKQEIFERREQEIKENDAISEKDTCRDLTLEEIETKLKSELPFALRLRSQGDGEKSRIIEDVFKGKREIRENAKDIILIKGDKIPTYAFGHLCDDVLMRTTKVIRGEDWYASLSAHMELFELAGFKPMTYGHAPVICTIDKETGNKRKLSKRHDPQADMRYYGQVGYPVKAVHEYLLTIANSDFEIWRAKNPLLSIFDFPFSLSKVGSSNPMFDMNKLNDISKNIIAKMTCEEINKRVADYYKDLKNPDRVFGILSIDRETPKPRKDIAKFSDVYELYDYIFDGFVNPLCDIHGEMSMLTAYMNVYNENDTKDEWFARIKQLCEEINTTPRNLTQVVRLAITGRENTPDLYTIMKILGKDIVVKRLIDYCK